MEKLTIAYIGNGKSANRYHLPFALKLADRIRVKTIFARHLRDDWERIPGVQYTTNLDDIYQDPEIQLVVLALPPEVHFQYAKDVLNHGKNVLVEKPFTQTVAEAKELFWRSGIPLYGAALRQDTLDARSMAEGKAAVAIGSEGRGLSREVLALCDATVRIPMAEHCESLNAAAAAAVLLWELARRDAPGK